MLHTCRYEDVHSVRANGRGVRRGGDEERRHADLAGVGRARGSQGDSPEARHTHDHVHRRYEVLPSEGDAEGASPRADTKDWR